jgi:lipoate-protein ligase B
MFITQQKKTFHSIDLGVCEYEDAFEKQRQLVLARKNGVIPDTVMLLEHPPVITIGRFRGQCNVTAPYELIEHKGIQVITTNRGGGATLHSPGQLVVYPILNLSAPRLGVKEYVWKLEEIIIRLLARLEVDAQRHALYPGSIWTNNKKICSIGIHVAQYITMHGLALNVSNDMGYFQLIEPCGLKSDIMTSIFETTGSHQPISTIKNILINEMAKVFSLEYQGEMPVNDLHETP